MRSKLFKILLGGRLGCAVWCSQVDWRQQQRREQSPSQGGDLDAAAQLKGEGYAPIDRLCSVRSGLWQRESQEIDKVDQFP